MYDYIDDQGTMPANLLGLEVSQDTEDRDAPAAYFAWPEERKYAMATEKDVLTSSVYFGLYGNQLPDDAQEKVAESLNRAIDAFGIRRAIEKIAVLPDYSRLSQNDIRALSREDTPTDRILRRLKRMGIYAGAGGVGGGVLGKLVTGKVNPFWAAIPAALAGGVGLAKGASAALMSHLLRDDDDLEAALENVEFDINTHAPPDRRKYAQALKTAAVASGAEVPGVVEQYAADTFGPRLEVGLEMRAMVDDGYRDFIDKHAHMSPGEFADTLYAMDMQVGTVVNSNIPDAYYTTFGKQAAEEEDITFAVVDGKPFKLSDATQLHKYKSVLDKILPANITDDLYSFPWRFSFLPDEYRIIIARAVFESRAGGDDTSKEPDKPDDEPDDKSNNKPAKKDR